jgi:hypothetical protein
LEEAHTLQLHLEQSVSNSKEELTAAGVEQDRIMKELNQELTTLQGQAATKEIELQLARSTKDALEIRQNELSG